jgi:adenine deaminase
MKQSKTYLGNLVDLFNEDIYAAQITVRDEKIVSIEKSSSKTNSFSLPGLVDAHIHIESSMLTPQQFGRIAMSHGTVAVVSDPHEIANVLGLDGVKYMIENSEGSDLEFFFGAPSCVPATVFESSGSQISANYVEYLLSNFKLKFLSELMNYPGVVNGEVEVLKKISIAKRLNKRIDGHAPGLVGENLNIYIAAGIETDHECSDLEEALEKIKKGMIIQIREGSAARNLDELWSLIDLYPERIFLCSDDLHPDDLLKGHINLLLKKALSKKVNLFNLLKTVTVNPITHYDLKMGLLRVGDRADFIRVDDLNSFEVSETYIGGIKVFDRAESLPEIPKQKLINKFNAHFISEKSLIVKSLSNSIKVIEVKDGELITGSYITNLQGEIDFNSDTNRDILKLVVLNRYEFAPPAITFIHGFNLKKGAICGSIAHDSHNIIAVGVSNKEIVKCINWIILNKGGIAVNTGEEIVGLPLPIAGIISDKRGEDVAHKYSELNALAKNLGCMLQAPFMTLSFMALLVIPELKLSDKGLFDVNSFCFTSLYKS